MGTPTMVRPNPFPAFLANHLRIVPLPRPGHWFIPKQTGFCFEVCICVGGEEEGGEEEGGGRREGRRGRREGQGIRGGEGRRREGGCSDLSQNLTEMGFSPLHSLPTPTPIPHPMHTPSPSSISPPPLCPTHSPSPHPLPHPTHTSSPLLSTHRTRPVAQLSVSLTASSLLVQVVLNCQNPVCNLNSVSYTWLVTKLYCPLFMS